MIITLHLRIAGKMFKSSNKERNVQSIRNVGFLEEKTLKSPKMTVRSLYDRNKRCL